MICLTGEAGPGERGVMMQCVPPFQQGMVLTSILAFVDPWMIGMQK